MSNPPGFSLDDSLELLRRTPSTLQALLFGLPDVWLRHDEGEGTWSAHDVVRHLIVVERTGWMPRVRFLLEHGEAKSSAALNRVESSSEEQAQQSAKPVEEILEEFARLRNDSLAGLRALNLKPADLSRRGKHPVFGTVQLSQLLSAWTVHDLTHLHQISRVMAHQYREAVGPWSAYLGVLHCAGHSEW